MIYGTGKSAADQFCYTNETANFARELTKEETGNFSWHFSSNYILYTYLPSVYSFEW